MRPPGSPFMRVEYDVLRTISIARLTHWLGRPIFCIILWRNSHSTLSYALLMSSFTAMCPFFSLALFLIRLSISKATVVLSVMILLGTKALCELEITLGSIGLRLLANTIDIIHDTTLPKLMGRSFVMYSGSFFCFLGWVQYVYSSFFLDISLSVEQIIQQ